MERVHQTQSATLRDWLAQDWLAIGLRGLGGASLLQRSASPPSQIYDLPGCAISLWTARRRSSGTGYRCKHRAHFEGTIQAIGPIGGEWRGYYLLLLIYESALFFGVTLDMIINRQRFSFFLLEVLGHLLDFFCLKIKAFGIQLIAGRLSQ